MYGRQASASPAPTPHADVVPISLHATMGHESVCATTSTTAAPATTCDESNASGPQQTDSAPNDAACKSTSSGTVGNPLSSFTVVNIRGLCTYSNKTKVAVLSDHLSLDKQLFAAVTETWLRDHRDA